MCICANEQTDRELNAICRIAFFNQAQGRIQAE